MSYIVITGDAATIDLEESSIQTIITSPPYFGQRNYGSGGAEIGRSQTLDEYIQSLVAVFRNLKHGLHRTGTIWVNLGDKRNGSGGAGGDYNKGGKREGQEKYPPTRVHGIPRRNLLGIPYRFAFAMQADGWHWMSDCVWNKLSGLPESCNDRPNYRHEVWLMFTKTLNFYFNKQHVKEYGSHGWNTVWDFRPKAYKGQHTATFHPELVAPIIVGSTPADGVCSHCFTPMVEVRKVVGRQVTDEMRFMGSNQEGLYNGTGQKDYENQKAANPSDVKRRVLEAQSRVYESDWKRQCGCSAPIVPATVLDPFCGAANAGIAALESGRSFVGIELNPSFVREGVKNLERCIDQAAFWGPDSFKVV